MDEAQITGAASSYARKYALNGLFAIDDTKDADTNEYRKNTDNAPKVIKKKVVNTPKEMVKLKKIEKTEEQKRAEAVTWTDNFMKELIKCKDGRDIMNLEHTDKNSIMLQAMRTRHPDLSTKIDNKLREIRSAFIESPSGL